MKVDIVFFASVREKVGLSELAVTLPPHCLSIDDLRHHLIELHPEWESVLGSSFPLRCALNQTMVDASAMLSSGDEIAFFPPVTGG